jgi:hypothetical protein
MSDVVKPRQRRSSKQNDLRRPASDAPLR